MTANKEPKTPTSGVLSIRLGIEAIRQIVSTARALKRTPSQIASMMIMNQLYGAGMTDDLTDALHGIHDTEQKGEQ